MLGDYVLKIRRDFSGILIPAGAYSSGARRKKSKPDRAYVYSRATLAGHASGCTCDDCVLLSDVVDTPAANDSENGYIFRSRSKQAIKNAANSIFFRSERKEYLRFITFTFPPLPVSLDSKVEEDKYLHKLFKKFLDNERKNYGLKQWLWTNERQSGDRLEDHERGAREVLHYHCVFEYEARINYYLVNLRFLRLLYRNRFDILSSYSKNLKKTSPYYSKLKRSCQALAVGDFDYLIKDTERMYLRDNLGIKRFIFLSPVDFERIRYSSLDIGKISAYITKYISKSSDKIYCRRWGSNQGLIIKDDQLKQFAVDNFPQENIDYDTGEIIITVNPERVFQFFCMGDPETKLFKFTVNIKDKEEELVYIPPNWQKWRTHSHLVNVFKNYFQYSI